MTQAYPLHWPAGVSRVQPHKRRHPKFVASVGSATKDLLAEVRMMGGTLPVISTNLALRNDGLPYANQRQPGDPGVAVYFQRRGKSLVFACDRWLKIEHNMRAIVKTIDAMRGIERWGSADMVDQAFAGFAALPPPMQWWAILGVPQAASLSEIETAWRGLMKTAHPDQGGNSDLAARLNAARDEGRARLSSPTNPRSET